MREQASAVTLSPWRNAVPRWTGRILQTAAAWSVLSYILFPFVPRFAIIVTTIFESMNLPGQPSLFNAALLWIVGAAARHRKRAAMWFIILWFQIWSALYLLLDGILVVFGDGWIDPERSAGRIPLMFRASPWWDVNTGVIAIAIIVILLVSRRAFSAKLEGGAWLRSVLIAVGGVVSAALIGFVLTLVAPTRLDSIPDKLWWSLNSALGLNPADTNLGIFNGRGQHWIYTVITIIASVGLLAALANFAWSVRSERAMNGDNELRIRRLLLRYGGNDSLGYFNTRRDKTATFSEDRRAAVVFTVVGATALASGDPVGDPKSWPNAIAQWTAQARRYGWTPAVLSASPQGAQAYNDFAGFRTLAIGDEAIIDVSTFDLAAPTMGEIRATVRRAEREGYRVLVRRQREIEPHELGRLASLADSWRHGASERGFSMASGRFGDPTDGESVIVVAVDGTDIVRGLLTFVPWGAHGLSLDVMRRDPEAMPGVTQYMVASLVGVGRELGLRRVSLNFAMFRRTFADGAKIGASAGQRLNRSLLLFASKWWQLESLYRSNEKYLPRWEPRLLCYDRGAQLSQIVWAAGQAEGFVPSWSERIAELGRRNARQLDVQPTAGFVREVREQEAQAREITVPERTLTAEQAARFAKRDAAIAAGIEPNPVAVARDHSLGEVRSKFEGLGDAGEGARNGTRTGGLRSGVTVSVAGRIMALRDHGGVLFATLREGCSELQVMLRADHVARQRDAREFLTRGDLVSVTGEVVTSRSGELSVDASLWALAAKSLQPMPDKVRGVTDPEAKVRSRHADVATSFAAMKIIQDRSLAVRALRRGLEDRGFLEVETPMLQATHGGANARPFLTHINAYDMELFLRIAPELALKKLAVGGVGKVFEIGRNFRNEGVDATHNPEFTSLEAYLAYADYSVMRQLTRELIIEAAVAIHGSPIALAADGSTTDLSQPWPVVTVHDAVSSAIGHHISSSTPRDELATYAAEHHVVIEASMSAGEIVVELYDALVESETQFPTFYTDFPVETSPLTRKHRDDPALAERWDLVAFGMELGTAYSELTDPVDQRDRLTAQSLKAAAGDPEAMSIDEDFLTALEFAMPPTGGLGLGVDRIVMLLTGTTIRQTLTFPFAKPTR